MILQEITASLYENRDAAYRDFQSALIPTVSKDCFIGVRTPVLRKMAKSLLKRKDIGEFLSALPHSTFDENQLHAFILSELKNFSECIAGVERFLPFVDNWATCDQLSPKVFRKHKTELLPFLRRFLQSDHPFTVRFGIGMLMQHFAEDDFSQEYPETISRIRSEEYYINMMIAWYFATLLAKQYDSILPYLEQRRLAPWTHNKTIQKAVESRRLTDEQKTYLRTLKVK